MYVLYLTSFAELSSTNRAGCKNKECLDNGIKIQKGELRFGTQIEIQEHQTWHWRHWGCVTPKQLANLNDTIGGNFNFLDGFDEITEEMQDKVTLALKEGHVDDHDWNGDVEYNRPGMTGMRKRTPKKKQADEVAENSDGNESPTKPAPKKRARAKKVAEDEGDGVPEEPAVKKTKAGTKRRIKVEVAENDADPEEEVPAPTKKTKGKSKKSTVATTEGDTKEEDRATQKRGGDNRKGTAAKKPKAPNQAVKAPRVKQEEDVDSGEGSEGPPKAKRRRKKAGDGSQTGVPNTTTKSRGKKAGGENVVDDDVAEAKPTKASGRAPRSKAA
ncbi:MAG: hypothetical protein M1830_006977 [Pleopsidium flavum]|nr:MAG: hypothetical protein M1830_006977 [Pleopsidium flavum]